MSATIHHEGLTWPLETFIDAQRFTRFDYDRDGHELPRFAEADVQGEAITRSGEIVSGLGSTLPWHDLIAYRSLNGGHQCQECGDWFDEGELCETGADMPVCVHCVSDWEY